MSCYSAKAIHWRHLHQRSIMLLYVVSCRFRDRECTSHHHHPIEALAQTQHCQMRNHMNNVEMVDSSCLPVYDTFIRTTSIGIVLSAFSISPFTHNPVEVSPTLQRRPINTCADRYTIQFRQLPSYVHRRIGHTQPAHANHD